jgi:hypothetical protein
MTQYCYKVSNINAQQLNTATMFQTSTFSKNIRTCSIQQPIIELEEIY